MNGQLAGLVPATQRELREVNERIEHQKIVAKLASSEVRFRRFFETANDCLLLLQADSGVVTDANPAMMTLLGLSSEQVVGEKIWELNPFKTVIANQADFLAVRHRVPFNFDDKFLETAAGLRVAVEFSGHAYSVADTEFLHFTLRDISNRKQLEEALRRETILFNNLSGAIPDNFYFKDRQSRFIRINEAMARRFGILASEAVGKTDFDFFSGAHAAQAHADEQRIMETGEPLLGIEEKETLLDGSVTWVSTTKVPLRDDEGRITGTVGISRDITATKNLQAQFLQAQKMKAFGQLAGGVAHDFNNILTSMLMGLNLIELELGVSETVRQSLRELEREVQRAAALTRQMLLLSRRATTETRTLDLNQILDGVCKMLVRLLGENISFQLKKPEGPLWIRADPGMVEQVVMNLCLNARDAMPQGGELTVETSGDAPVNQLSSGNARPSRFVRLSVRDTGCGMDEATQKRIFEPFFTTKEPGKGTGLGLATVYGIMKQHRGWVEVESAPGKGSTFRIYFPVQQPGDTSETPVTAAPPLRGGTEKILLVEDEAVLRDSIALFLRRVGYQVVTAGSGPEALRIWGEQKAMFDLLLTDTVMPGGMTGIELSHQLSCAKPALKVIITTGYYSDANDTPLPPGATRLMKPFKIDVLLESVRHCFKAKPAS